jgi:hypothetical protein
LSEHYAKPRSYGVDDIFYAVRKNSDFKSHVIDPEKTKKECILDIIAFGCDQVIIYSINNGIYLLKHLYL